MLMIFLVSIQESLSVMSLRPRLAAFSLITTTAAARGQEVGGGEDGGVRDRVFKNGDDRADVWLRKRDEGWG